MQPEQEFDIAALMEAAQTRHQQMIEAQEGLERALVTGRSRGGELTLLVSGLGKIKDVRVDPMIWELQDADRLGRAIVEAIEAAGANASALATQQLGETTINLF